jgi:hypothetical protein
MHLFLSQASQNPNDGQISWQIRELTCARSIENLQNFYRRVCTNPALPKSKFAGRGLLYNIIAPTVESPERKYNLSELFRAILDSWWVFSLYPFDLEDTGYWRGIFFFFFFLPPYLLSSIAVRHISVLLLELLRRVKKFQIHIRN